ncbi:MAG TPA: hypothetical protein PKE21_08945 [Flavobacteriales bacterium]|nr:hypothetical protein [Flavobacteriales bacterium]HMR27589.1 hypothetical protein [Flavobacteriales bacterium]
MSDIHTGAAAPARPTLLTVICILSFLAGAWGLVSGVRNAFTDAPQAAVAEMQGEMEKAMAEMGDQQVPMVEEMMASALSMAEKAAEHAKPLGYGEIAFSLLSLFGVWNMWNLKRSGFWIYLVASIGGVVMPLVYLGGGIATILGLGVGGLITVVFIVLYAVNLKHMR